MTTSNHDVNVAELFRDVATTLMPGANAAGVSIAIDIRDGIDEIINDKLGLRRIVTTLIGNAVKYSQFGDKVNALVEVRDEHFHLSVQDECIDVAPDQITVMFEGSAGEIEIQSIPGIGTTVTIDLPMAV